MPLFCIIGRDAPGSTEKRERLMEKHLVHLKTLNKEKRLIVAGPFFDGQTSDSHYCGTLLIVDFKTLEQARYWFEQDPYYQQGVYKTLEIFPYIDAMPYCE